MIRVERLVVPAAKSCCSISRVRFPARAHSRAMATPLIPPPTITTWKRSLSREGRAGLGEIMFQIRCYAVRASERTPRPKLKSATFRLFRKGHVGSAKGSRDTSKHNCNSMKIQEQWAVASSWLSVTDGVRFTGHRQLATDHLLDDCRFRHP